MDLERRVLTEVDIILAEGDRHYLLSLPRAAFVKILEDELQFLGLYAYGDTETPARIHEIVERHYWQWRSTLVASLSA